MKKISLQICALLAINAFSATADPVLVASFILTRFDGSGKGAELSPNSLHFIEAQGGGDIAYPYLVREAAEYGIYDFIKKRVLWLGDQFTIRKATPYEVEGDLQGDGIHAKYYADGLLLLYRESRTAFKEIRIALPDQDRPLAGGGWYQSDTLFFYDQNGELQVLENPAENSAQNLGNLKDRNYAKEAIGKFGKSKLKGLEWNDTYGVTRHGLPLSKVFNADWDAFLSTQRKNSGTMVDERHQIPPASWDNSMRLLGVSSDGITYWGTVSASIVDRSGFVVSKENWQSPIGNPVILPSGDILLRSISPVKGTFKLYLVRRNW